LAGKYFTACVLAVILALGSPPDSAPVQREGRPYLVFVRDAGGGSAAHSDELWGCDLSGERQFRISNLGEHVVGPVVYSSLSHTLGWWSIRRQQAVGLPHRLLRVYHLPSRKSKTIYVETKMHPDDLSISPDGQYLLFGRSRGEFGNGPVEDHGIWQVRIDGTGIRSLTRGFGARGRSLYPAISPDGSLIAFFGYLHEEVGNLCLVDRAGGDSEILSVEIRDFAWYPSGKHLVVAQAGPDDDAWYTRLAEYEVATRRLRALTAYRGDSADHTPVFSPDGQRLAYFSSDYRGQTDANGLKVLSLDGSSVRTITTGGGLFSSACAWAPDGESLFYVIRRFEKHGVDFQIWHAGINGSGRHKVIDHARSPLIVAGL